MKHDDLWNDALDDELPRDLASRSLGAMKQESRRRQIRGRATVGASILALGLAGGWFVMMPEQKSPAIAQIAPSPGLEVRMISETELVSRLVEMGIGVAITHTGNSREFLLIAQDGEVYRP